MSFSKTVGHCSVCDQDKYEPYNVICDACFVRMKDNAMRLLQLRDLDEVTKGNTSIMVISEDRLKELESKAQKWDEYMQSPSWSETLEKAQKWDQHVNDMTVCGNPTGYQVREWKDKAKKYDAIPHKIEEWRKKAERYDKLYEYFRHPQ